MFPQAIRCVHSSQTRRLPPTSGWRSHWQGLHFNGDDHESPHIRAHDVPRRHCDLRITGRQLCTDEARSEEHTSELQSPCNLVCRLLLEKKKTHYDCERE